MARICKFAGWSVGHLCVVDRSATPHCLISSGIWQGVEGEGFQEFRRATQAMGHAFDRDLPGRLWAARAPAWIVDVGTDGDFGRAPSARVAGLISAVGFPVMAHCNVAAVLEFFSCRRVKPDPVLLEVITQIAKQLGFLIERQRSAQKLTHDASRDPLTGLPNRAMFLDRLTRAIARNKRDPGASFAMLFIDLDRFKMVNDSFGHLAGDSLIVEVAARFQNTIHETDMVARPHAIPASAAGAGAPSQARAGRGRSRSLPPSLPTDHHDDHGGHAGQRAVDDRQRDRRRDPPAPGLRHRRWPHHQPGAPPLEDARGL
jgi:hypothetical protein